MINSNIHPPSPILPQNSLSNSIKESPQASSPMFYNLPLHVPYGTRVVYEKWCSPQFFHEVMNGAYPKNKGMSYIIQINPKFAHIFERLESIYADRLWNAIKEKGRKGSLHFNFNREDFSRTGMGTPRQVCNMFCRGR